MENLNERDAEAIIDDLLKDKGWNGNPRDDQRNITRQNVFDEYKKQMGRKFPDYVFYDNSRSPLCVLEVKKPKEKNKNTLDKALEQAKNYARKIDCPLAIASNGFVYISYHLDFQREYLINNKPLNDLPTPQELVVVHSQYFFNTYRGKVLTNQEEFRKLLKKIDDKLWQEGLKEGDERFTEFCKLLFLRLISHPNDLESSWNKVMAQSKTSDDTIITIINGELEKHQDHYKIDKYISSLNIQSSNIVKAIIKEINEIDFAESDFDAKGVIFEYFLGQRGKDDLAQYFTPRNIVRFMVNFLEPKLGETVYDPFCGSGGMLIEAYEFIRKQILLDEKYQDNINFLKKETLYGNDKASIAYVAKLNMILIGDGHNNIERCDSLKKKVRRPCDIVITNIPFNISTEFGNLYSYPTSEANSICIQHIIANLKTTPNARAGIIVPNIFVSGDGLKELRKDIEENFTITVISLPEGTFQPYTPSNAYILFIKRKQLVIKAEREREREREENANWILSSSTNRLYP